MNRRSFLKTAAGAAAVPAAAFAQQPEAKDRVVKTPVLTSQVAATILKSLDIDPNELQAVRKEGIQALPFVFSGQSELH